MKRFFVLVFTAAVVLFAVGCGSKIDAKKASDTPQQTPPPTEMQAKPLNETTEAPPPADVAKAKIDTITTPSGLKYYDVVAGNGATPQAGQYCTVHYTGWLTDGKKFDSSRDNNRPYKFLLGRGKVIKGWDEGIATMRVGGTRTLIIPPELAYGDKGTGGGLIPPNSTLIFQVELLGIE